MTILTVFLIACVTIILWPLISFVLFVTLGFLMGVMLLLVGVIVQFFHFLFRPFR
jgi:hypothetical protein